MSLVKAFLFGALVLAMIYLTLAMLMWIDTIISVFFR